MTGRPSEYDPAVAADVCERIATTPRGLDFILSQDDNLPAPATIHKWLNAQPAFVESYLRARERQADLIFDQSLEIADTPLVGVETVTKPDGSKEVREGDMLGHRKLQVDTRMRMAGKLAPKKYGDRTVIAGDKDAPLAVADVSDLERAKAVAALVAAAQRGKAE